MTPLYLTLLVLGISVLVLQLVLGLLGADDGGALDDAHTGDALDLFTVRALSAASATIGLVGLVATRAGFSTLLALPLALATGLAAAAGVAALMRSMKRLEVDKSFRIATAVGLPAKVSLSIPGNRGGEGKIHLIAHEQFLELTAVTADGEIPTGEDVIVVDTVGSATVLVTRSTPLLEELQ